MTPLSATPTTAPAPGLAVLVGDAVAVVLVEAHDDAVVRRMRRAVRSRDRWVALEDGLHVVLLVDLPRFGLEGVVERVTDALLLAAGTGSVSVGASVAGSWNAEGNGGTGDGETLRRAVEALDAARRAGGGCARVLAV